MWQDMIRSNASEFIFRWIKDIIAQFDGDIKITEQFLADVAKRMRWLSDEKIPIKKKTIHTDDAIELFHRHGMYDKEKLFEYRRVSKVNIYSINEFEDYYYGYMVPDTGYLKYFSLHLYDEALSFRCR